MDEFNLIERFFQIPARKLNAASVAQGIGDDCAVLNLRSDEQLVVTTDLLLKNRHFLANTDPYRLGHKALAVNLSDLASCAAEPLAFTLSLALEQADPIWLESFAAGMLALAKEYRCPLVGGDTTKGPLTLGITAMGQVPRKQALLRSGAQVGDLIYVSGAIGEARAGLAIVQKQLQINNTTLRKHLIKRLEKPTPRLALGIGLRGLAHAAIDLSDGLRGDLGHILKASGVGAQIDGPALLCSSKMWQSSELALWSQDKQIAFAMAGGDDYELLFTVPESNATLLSDLGERLETELHCIGTIIAGGDLEVLDVHGNPIALVLPSFNHFST